MDDMEELANQMRLVFDDAALDVAVSILTEATSQPGDGLNPEVRGRVLALLSGPGPDTWDAAYSIVLNGSKGLTLWQAMKAVDVKCPPLMMSYDTNEHPTPERKWMGYAPRPFLVLAALQSAVEQ